MTEKSEFSSLKTPDEDLKYWNFTPWKRIFGSSVLSNSLYDISTLI